MSTVDGVDLKDPPECVSYKEPTKTLPAGYRVEVWIKDQWGERRKKSQTFRAGDDTERSLFNALQKAVEWREHIKEKSTDIRWLRKTFPEPVDKEVINGPEEFFDWADRHTPDDSEDALQDFVERGMIRGNSNRLVQDPNSIEMGYLRRIKTDNGIEYFQQQVGIWNVIVEYGCVHQKKIGEIKGTDVDDFVRYLESKRDDDGNFYYSKTTIKNYRARLRSMIKRFAIDQEVMNPLDISPPLRNPRQIKGREKKRKVPTEGEMEQFRKGFQKWINKSKRFKHTRLRAFYVFRVLRDTGMRPSEAFYLQPRHVDTIGNTITVEGAVTEDGEGGTKSEKLGAENGERIVPVADRVVDAITGWIDEREEYGYPSIQECPIVFCTQEGDHSTDDWLRDHFVAACDQTEDDELRIRPYHMRHWRNDQLRKRGCPVEIRSAVIGHGEDVNPNYTDVKSLEARDYIEE